MLYKRERVVSAISEKSVLFGQAVTLKNHRLLVLRRHFFDF